MEVVRWSRTVVSVERLLGECLAVAGVTHDEKITESQLQAASHTHTRAEHPAVHPIRLSFVSLTCHILDLFIFLLS